ncbi:5-formyltetrahydrofolate cyclo-ligase [Methylophaga sp. OBS1]|jgi:5-formyltetrahydrofolate cyclo-ligase|uniref:5-formyltetrahydrofolate cyclo-ligase n=1 Tax=Methylophaga sp. OBS1 TaxID=2991933 RepID=UPI00224F58DA|nr:5-formyltetrahydrofolate cyclo-ligase [Methylophaga sp. OBS1]MCX4191440.1 5-formyltetrahydrofolate cyclo-ligase [Methylophaga sp. OBS1]MCX4191616.1 5-formyltetrahydrofolate cyclo-ligase [Methylophaga sp. OBS1]
MKTWRQEQRQRLLEERASLTEKAHKQISKSCLAHVAMYLEDCPPDILGIYWPIKGEIDCRVLAEGLLGAGWTLAVPVINNRSRLLDFARWQPDTPMIQGTWNIPVPAQPEWLTPSRFLVPLVGFDKAHYRLGYGGGYYDRTLAERSEPVETIGVGMEMGRLETIHPHALDIPMMRIITETGLQLPEPQANSDI